MCNYFYLTQNKRTTRRGRGDCPSTSKSGYLYHMLDPQYFLLQPDEWGKEESRELFSRHDTSHKRALIALALFFPTGIFALFYSLKVGGRERETIVFYSVMSAVYIY